MHMCVSLPSIFGFQILYIMLLYIAFSLLFLSVLDGDHVFSGLSERGHAHCAGPWLNLLISDHMVMDRLVCFSRYFRILLAKIIRQLVP